jgi:hypothetical protein
VNGEQTSVSLFEAILSSPRVASEVNLTQRSDDMRLEMIELFREVFPLFYHFLFVNQIGLIFHHSHH